MIASLPIDFLASSIDSQYSCFVQVVIVRRAQVDVLPITSKILDGIDRLFNSTEGIHLYIHTHSPDRFTEVISIIITNYFTQLDKNNYKFRLMKSITMTFSTCTTHVHVHVHPFCLTPHAKADPPRCGKGSLWIRIDNYYSWLDRHGLCLSTCHACVTIIRMTSARVMHM